MKDKIVYVVLLVILGFIMAFFSKAALATEVLSLNLEFTSVVNKHDEFIPEYTVYESSPGKRADPSSEVWSYGVDLNFNLSLFKSNLGHTYWNNTIMGLSTTKQFRYVSWEFEFGQELGKNLDLFYHHQSEHVLEMSRDKYPLHDTVGIRLNLIK